MDCGQPRPQGIQRARAGLREVCCRQLIRPNIARKLFLVVSWKEDRGWLRSSWLKGKIGDNGQTDYHHMASGALQDKGDSEGVLASRTKELKYK